jgi:hypothetical protein
LRKKKRSVTTIEAHQFFVIRRPENIDLSWCVECPAGQSIMITPDEAATLAGLSSREIYKHIEAGTIHYRESLGGMVLVCLNSLSATSTLGNLIQKGEES